MVVNNNNSSYIWLTLNRTISMVQMMVIGMVH